LSDDLALAERAARHAGELLMERYGGPARGLGRKSSRTDMVSDADREAERAIKELLAAERPQDGLLAEEGSSREVESGRRWVVDPLDGTTNFLYGYPAWCVSVALEDAQGGLVGVVHDPLRDETFTAERGSGAHLTGEPIEISGHDEPATALVATGFGYDAERRAWQAETLTRVLPRVRDIRRGGAAALDLSWVACGRLDGYYEYGLQAWDWAAASVIVKEAGGITRRLEGAVSGLAAGSERLVEQLTALIEG
jgi:myo-inositol-1(or 4)-monophosphatase